MEKKNCGVCGNGGELRLGVCWDCATAESIISEGVDMFENGAESSEEPAKTAMQKLKFLIERGWRMKDKAV